MAQRDCSDEAPTVVSLPRNEIASIADALDSERKTIEKAAGRGPKTEELSEYVEEFRSALSVLDDSDDVGHVRRVAAAGAADALDSIAETELGGYAADVQQSADAVKGALGDESTGSAAEVLSA